MDYPKQPDFNKLTNLLKVYSKYKHEYGVSNTQDILDKAYSDLSASLEEMKNLPVSNDYLLKEPNDLIEIRKLRPNGPRRQWETLDKEIYLDKLEGALLTRMAGCILGAPFEFARMDHMENWAKYTNETFPPIDYWKMIKNPYELRYGKGDFISYTKEGMDKVPVDDDIIYTMLGLLIAEEYGTDFTTDDVAKVWKKYLPYACTAEEIAIENIKDNVPVEKVAEINNPYDEWIGADIRSDTFAYIAPAYPEKAASMAYYDAYISHRRNGIYGEMFFAAAQSAAFFVDSPIEALEIGLTEIPKDCWLASDIRWALEKGKTIKNYKEARSAVDKRFGEMEHAHTNNNACLTVFGLMIGGTDITKVLSETVAMGMDNDCTAATAGSIVGAIVGKKNMPAHWYKNFNNSINSYLIGIDEMKIDDVVNRFAKLAQDLYSK